MQPSTTQFPSISEASSKDVSHKQKQKYLSFENWTEISEYISQRVNILLLYWNRASLSFVQKEEGMWSELKFYVGNLFQPLMETLTMGTIPKAPEEL